MKTKNDPRHQKRIQIVKDLFALSFHPNQRFDDELTSTIKDVLPTIDSYITKSAPEWPIDKIAKIDLAILRMAVFELTISKKEPPKAIIDEAVEIAKEFGNDTSAKFINGALGTIYSWQK